MGPSRFRTASSFIAGSLLIAAICAGAPANQSSSPLNAADVKPSPQQVEWQDLQFGVLIHFGTNTYLDREWGDGTASPSVFNPTEFDPDQWMRAIKAAGAKYVVLVAKHHDGFCLWPTDQTNYSVKSSPWENGHGDVVRAVSDAARKFGLKFGVYLSPWDRHDPRYKNSAEYDKLYMAEIDELTNNYGDLVEWWLDGAGSAGHVYDFPRYIDELRIAQPNTLVFADMALFEYGDIRWAGNEDGRIPYENWNVIDRHGYLRWRPVEADTPLHARHWFWHPNDESTLKSVAELMTTYEQTVGHGGQLMLGVAPDRRGLLPDADVKRLEEFGAAIRNRYGKSVIMETHIRTNSSAEAALDGDPDTFWSAPPGSHHAMLEVSFPKPVTFDRALTMEWLNDGQHIEKYRIEVWEANGTASDGKGVRTSDESGVRAPGEEEARMSDARAVRESGGKRTRTSADNEGNASTSERASARSGWTTIVEGGPVGHEKIDIFPAVTASRVRLNILSSTAAAHIREFQLFLAHSPD